jgi:polysaccharide deacetylase 2 family uncharacterized protein YibQ
MSEPKPMYPVLAKAIERGRLTEASRPDPRQRKLRSSDPWQIVDDLAGQVGWERRILTLPDVKWAFRCAMPAIEAFEETL